MFDRRVKIFLSILILLIGVLLARAVQLQVVEHATWADKAVVMMSTGDLVDTTRGRLLDRKGLVIAEDAPCIDACVDYRAIAREPDEDWVKTQAKIRLNNRLGTDYSGAEKTKRDDMVKQETARVLEDIDAMWLKLAQFGKMTPDEMDDLRQSIQRKVEMRRRNVWYARYQNAVQEQQQEKRKDSPWYQRWLSDDGQDLPDLDEFDIKVGEQFRAHVILPAIKSDIANFLEKNQDKYPGLAIQRGTHRYYPFGDAAAHVIGHLAYVSKNDKEYKQFKDDELAKYYDNDLIGRSGLEALCEPLLRGKRGKIKRITGEDGRLRTNIPAVAGADVRTTIDIKLQKELQELFTHVLFKANSSDTWADPLRMLGSAVVIDIPTGEVISLVSYPSYDLNTMDENYAKLVSDYVENPLLNRATQVALEPGSTVKPMVGLGAITQGLISTDFTVECTGYLTLNGHQYQVGRCWTATSGGPSWGHHVFPYPHVFPVPGFLTYSDALERSCNVFFETVADKMGMDRLRYWYDQFGLGHPTGIGIAESKGAIPLDRPVLAVNRKYATWFSGIGQSEVLATPLQMANVTATIARDGILVRPRLVPRGVLPTTSPVESQPDRVDLHLSPEGLREAKKGMYQVVNSPSGTGRYHDIEKLPIKLAAKTGSAQAAPLKISKTDEFGQIVFETYEVPVADPDTGAITVEQRTRPEKITLRVGTHENKNPLALWYRGTGTNQDKISHAWYVGFAPADHPKIAFAVMVQYGGGGGATAGYVAKGVLEALIEHGYLAKQQ